jgi:hypothetical protein
MITVPAAGNTPHGSRKMQFFPLFLNSAGFLRGLAPAPHLSQYLLQCRLVWGNERSRSRDCCEQLQQMFGLSSRQRQVCREDRFGANLTNLFQCLAESARLNHMNPWAVRGSPGDDALSQMPLCNIIRILCRRRDDSAKAIGREKGFRFVIIDTDSSRVIEQGRSDGGQLAVTHTNTFSRI